MSLLPRLGSLGQRRYDPNANPDEIVGIDQQRRLAAALQQQGLESPQGQMIGSHFVGPSWTQQLAQGLKLGAGAYIDNQANEQQRDYNNSRTKKFADILSGNKAQQIPGAPVQTSTMPAYEPEQQDRFGSPLPNVERQPVVTETIPMQQETPTQVNERIQPQILEYIQKYGNTPEAQYLLGQMNKQDDRAYAKGEKLEDRAYTDTREEKLYNRGRTDKLSDIDAERKYQDIVRKDQQGFQVSQQDRQFEQAYKMQAQNQNFTAGQNALNRNATAEQGNLNRAQQLEIAGLKNPSGKVDPATQKVNDANDVLGILKQAAPLINQSTSSGIGNIVDNVYAFGGGSTTGAQAAASLKALEGSLVSKMPKMSGPQSDKDVLLYKQMAGQIGDPSIPAAQKKSAMQTINEINSKYAGVDLVPLDFGDNAKNPLNRANGASPASNNTPVREVNW